jgi:hypothetical protein
LCPLLVAQQLPAPAMTSEVLQTSAPARVPNAPPTFPEFITIPKDTNIELIALESVSSETAVTGSSVRFAVTKDLVINGVTVIHAGMPLTGTITRVRRGSHKANRNGQLRIQLNQLEAGKTVKLRLVTIRWTSRIGIRKALTDAAIWIVFFPLVLRLAKGFSQDEKTGDDALLPRCFHITKNVVTGQRIHPAQMDRPIADPMALRQVSCPANDIGLRSSAEIR